jgi:predicted nucleotidyltransferase component of viral defense system
VKQPVLSPDEERAMESVLQGWVLQAISLSKKDYGKWVFHGGTALKKAFQSMRYSEDLDFMIEPDLDTAALMQRVADHVQVLSSVSYGSDAQIRLKARASDKNPKMYHVVLTVPSLTMSSVKVKVEFSPTQHLEMYVKTSLLTPPDVAMVRHKVAQAKSVRLEVGNLEQIYIDKWVALTMRPEIKHRDVWDLSWLLERAAISAIPASQSWSQMQQLVKTFYPDNDQSNVWVQTARHRFETMASKQYINDFVADMQRWLDSDLASMQTSLFQDRVHRVLGAMEGILYVMEQSYGIAQTPTH